MPVQFEFERPFSFFDFDSKKLKPFLREVGKGVRRGAKSRLSVVGRSQPGEAPGKQSGVMAKSVKYRVTKTGFSVFIRSEMRPEMKVFYPAFVFFGHAAPGHKGTKEKVAKPRQNVFQAEAEVYGRTKFPSIAKEALEEALKEGLIA